MRELTLAEYQEALTHATPASGQHMYAACSAGQQDRQGIRAYTLPGMSVLEVTLSHGWLTQFWLLTRDEYNKARYGRMPYNAQQEW